MVDEPRRDPPAAADEAAMLRAWLDFYRATVRRQCAGLDAQQLARTLPPSTITLGGMLKHLAFVEGYWLHHVLLGRAPDEPWASAPFDEDPDWDWHSAVDDDPAAVRDLHAAEVRTADAVLDAVLVGEQGLDTTAAVGRQGRHVTLRWILLHLLEEYARHAGHADLVRESVDGAVDL